MHAGFRAQQQVEEDQQNGVEPSHRKELSEFNQKLQNNG